MRIRRLRPNEAAQLRARRALGLGTDSVTPAVDYAREGGCSLEAFEARIAPGSDATFVALDAVGQMVGLALAALDRARRDRALVLVWAEASERGAEAERALVERLVATAAAAGITDVEVRMLDEPTEPVDARIAAHFAAARARRPRSEGAGPELVRRPA